MTLQIFPEKLGLSLHPPPPARALFTARLLSLLGVRLTPPVSLDPTRQGILACAFMPGRRRTVPRNGSTNGSTNGSPTELFHPNGSASYPSSPSSSSGAVNLAHGVNTNGNRNGHGRHVQREESADAGAEVGIELTREVMGASKSKEHGGGRGSKASNGYEVVEREEPLLHADDDEDPDKPDADERYSTASCFPVRPVCSAHLCFGPVRMLEDFFAPESGAHKSMYGHVGVVASWASSSSSQHPNVRM